MKRTFGIFTVAIVLGGTLGYVLRGFVDQNTCLDRGGRWNHEWNGCEFEPPPAFLKVDGRDETVNGQHQFIPTSGFVPDSLTAIRIAYAILTPIHDVAGSIANERLAARLQDGIWNVESEETAGDAAVEISKANGRVRRAGSGSGEVVPDSITAIRIAEAVLTPIYGNDTVVENRPFEARLDRGIWYVNGSLPPAAPGSIMLGGVAEVELARADGRIIRVSHSM